MTLSQQLQPIVRYFFEMPGDLKAGPIGAGNINDTYRIDFQIKNTQQSWLLQRLNHEVFTDPHAVMQNIWLVAEQLQQQPGFPLQIPAPQPGLDGRLLQRDVLGNYWRVFPFYKNCFAPEQRPDPTIAYEAARAYGIFLSALRDCPVTEIRETIPNFHDTDKRWAAFQKLLEQDPAGRVSSVQAEIEACYTAKPVFDSVGALKRSGELPLRIVHNDTKAGNVLLDTDTGKAIAVIDWDTIMPGTVLSDFGDMVRSFTPDVVEDEPGKVHLRTDVLEALLEGFLDQTADFLTATERAHLPLGAQWIIAEQALRFLSDYLAGDRYYKIRYPEHNLVRARNQLALLRAVVNHYA